MFFYICIYVCGVGDEIYGMFCIELYFELYWLLLFEFIGIDN